jgi:guanylate kinase
VIKGLLAANRDLSVAVSATTRSPRPGEIHGQAYYFLTDSEFDTKVTEDAFLEWCWVHDKRYGTLKSEVQRLQGLGKNVILEIDTQGAAKIKVTCPDAYLIFIAPPQESDLETRLRGRASDSEETITRRLLVAKKELACKDDYHIVVVNDVVDRAVDEILAYIKTK